MKDRIKYALNWINFHLGGLRGDCMLEIGNPLENTILSGIFEGN